LFTYIQCMGYQCFSVLLRYLYRIIKHLNEEATKVLFYNNMIFMSKDLSHFWLNVFIMLWNICIITGNNIMTSLDFVKLINCLGERKFIFPEIFWIDVEALFTIYFANIQFILMNYTIFSHLFVIALRILSTVKPVTFQGNIDIHSHKTGGH
jgi:hypothetical protein